MKSRGIRIVVLAALAVAGAASGTAAGIRERATPRPPDALPTRSPGRGAAPLPVEFEPNRGQADPRARFVARPRGYTALLADDGLIVADCGREAVRMRFARTRPGASLTGAQPLAGRSNYYRGNDPRRRLTGVPHFGEAETRGLYAGVDLRWRADSAGNLEYDLVLAPGGDLDAVRVEFPGSRDVGIDPDGSLRVVARDGALRQSAPVAWQDAPAGRRPVACSFVLRGGHVGFEAPRRDPSLPLVVDPVLGYASYLGGSASDFVNGVAAAPGGAMLTAGQTSSSDFPVAGGLDPSRDGYQDGFVAKVQADGSALAWATYFGGSTNDSCAGLAADSSGNAYVTGFTDSSDFPTAPGSPLDATLSGGTDAFVAKLDGATGTLAYSTYLGGTGPDYGSAVAVDGSGRACVVGSSGGDGFPGTPEPPLEGSRVGGYDLFVARLDAPGTSLEYGRYVGGSQNDTPTGIAVDSGGAVYVVGYTPSADFPTAPQGSALDSTLGGDVDAFVAKIDAAGTTLVYATYLGGASYDWAYGVAVDGSGAACVVGSTTSSDFPTAPASPLDGSIGGEGDAFVVKLSPAGTALSWSTFLGGGSYEEAYAVAAGADGAFHVTGVTASSDFPRQPPGGAALVGTQDAFYSKFASDGSMGFSTFVFSRSSQFYLGAGQMEGRSIAVLGPDTVLIGGSTNSSTLLGGLYGPAVDTTYAGGEGFLAQVNVLRAPAAPTNLAVASYDGSLVQLSWTDNSDNETGFLIEGTVRDSFGGERSFDQPVGPGETSVLLPFNPHAHAVLAISARNESLFSSSSNAITLDMPWSFDLQVTKGLISDSKKPFKDSVKVSGTIDLPPEGLGFDEFSQESFLLALRVGTESSLAALGEIDVATPDALLLWEDGRLSWKSAKDTDKSDGVRKASFVLDLAAGTWTLKISGLEFAAAPSGKLGVDLMFTPDQFSTISESADYDDWQPPKRGKTKYP